MMAALYCEGVQSADESSYDCDFEAIETVGEIAWNRTTKDGSRINDGGELVGE